MREFHAFSIADIPSRRSRRAYRMHRIVFGRYSRAALPNLSSPYSAVKYYFLLVADPDASARISISRFLVVSLLSGHKKRYVDAGDNWNHHSYSFFDAMTSRRPLSLSSEIDPIYNLHLPCLCSPYLLPGLNRMRLAGYACSIIFLYAVVSALLGFEVASTQSLR